MAVLSLKELSCGYGKKVIVKGIELEADAGEMICLIGQNGSGKSTVLKTIASMIPPISGSILIDGKNRSDISRNEAARIMSVLFTERVNYDRMTCFEAVSAGRYPYTGRLGILSDDDKRIVNDAMKLTKTYELRDSDIRFISDGQRQLVMLARAIAQQPRIMILDEPSSFLDINNKLRLLGILKKLTATKNMTVIMSLHELELAKQFADRLICIKNGAPDKTGTPDEILSDGYIKELFDIDDEYTYEISDIRQVIE